MHPTSAPQARRASLEIGRAMSPEMVITTPILSVDDARAAAPETHCDTSFNLEAVKIRHHLQVLRSPETLHMSLDHRRSLFASEAEESSGSLRSEAMDMSSAGVLVCAFR